MKAVKPVQLVQLADLKDPYANEPVITVVPKKQAGGYISMTQAARETLAINEINTRIEFAYAHPEPQEGVDNATLPFEGVLRAISSETFEMLNINTKNMNKVDAPVVKDNNSFTSSKIHAAICTLFGLSEKQVEGGADSYRFRLIPCEGGYCMLSYINPNA